MHLVAADTVFAVIAARSERQAMDWSLVLASQDIPARIERMGEKEWALWVAPQDEERAWASIRQYRLENRRWKWTQPLPRSGLLFHWGGLFWCLLIAAVHKISVLDLPRLRDVWVLNSQAFWSGEWWRAFTAILLHADLGHLLANMTTGFLLLGLAMARFGAGWGLLASYASGVAGNLFGLVLYQTPYTGLGASGMVMGALGLISIPTLSAWRLPGPTLRVLLKGALAGILLFVLLGTNPASDVLAHLGGFVAGVLLGGLLSAAPKQVLAHPFGLGVGWLTLIMMVILTGWLGLKQP